MELSIEPVQMDLDTVVALTVETRAALSRRNRPTRKPHKPQVFNLHQWEQLQHLQNMKQSNRRGI